MDRGRINSYNILLWAGIAVLAFQDQLFGRKIDSRSIGGMKKVEHKGYKGYADYYEDTYFVVWNAGWKNNDWYVDVIESPYNFSERDFSYSFKTKREAISHLKYLVEKEKR